MSTVNTTVDASTMLLSYSVDGESFSTIVCETDSNYDGTMTIVSDETKCGRTVAPGTIANKFSGTGVVNTTPDADEGSYNEIQDHFLSKQQLYFRYTNVDESIYHAGVGWFTQLGNQNAANGTSKFTWTVEINGDITNTVGSS